MLHGSAALKIRRTVYSQLQRTHRLLLFQVLQQQNGNLITVYKRKINNSSNLLLEPENRNKQIFNN